jgi:cytochrome c553
MSGRRSRARAGWARRALVVGCVTCAAVATAAFRSPAAAQAATVVPASGTPFEIPSWAYPMRVTGSAEPPDSTTPRHLAGSRIAVTDRQIANLFGVPDWYPNAHPAMPSVVARGRAPVVFACAYCHLATGGGRPENATLAGLSVAYIVAQVSDMRSRARQTAWHTTGTVRTPSAAMVAIADSVRPAELAQAAEYFSRLSVGRRARVVEAATVPRTVAGVGLYLPAPGGGVEPIGHRLIEMPVDATRHEMHDPNVVYEAYVAPGSIARGRALATTATPGGAASCTSCHGPWLRGLGVVPPIAGRSPSYILRQLIAFRTGSRSAPSGAPMRAVAAFLGLDDMIAAAAYAGSLDP